MKKAEIEQAGRRQALATRELPPVVYHMAEAVNWPSIEHAGLLSARALLELAGVPENEHGQAGHTQRTEPLFLPGGMVIRDQRPMPPAALERCLHGMTPAQWYELLNSQVFFWLDIERLNRMRMASSKQAQVVMVMDTAQLLTHHSKRVSLTPINTGNARRQPAQRGAQTFVPYRQWLESGWTSETQALGTPPRPRSHQPVELTIADAVRNALDCMREKHYLEPGELFQP